MGKVYLYAGVNGKAFVFTHLFALVIGEGLGKFFWDGFHGFLIGTSHVCGATTSDALPAKEQAKRLYKLLTAFGGRS